MKYLFFFILVLLLKYRGLWVGFLGYEYVSNLSFVSFFLFGREVVYRVWNLLYFKDKRMTFVLESLFTC